MFKITRVYRFDSRDLSVELLDLDMYQKCKNNLEEGEYIIYYNRQTGTVECDKEEDTNAIKKFWFHVFDYENYPVANKTYNDAMKFFMEMSLSDVNSFREYTYSLSGGTAHILVKHRPFWDKRLKAYLQEDFAQQTYEWCGYA